MILYRLNFYFERIKVEIIRLLQVYVCNVVLLSKITINYLFSPFLHTILFIYITLIFFGFFNIMMYIINMASVMKKRTVKELIFENYYRIWNLDLLEKTVFIQWNNNNNQKDLLSLPSKVKKKIGADKSSTSPLYRKIRKPEFFLMKKCKNSNTISCLKRLWKYL